MINCPICGTEFNEKTGRRPKKFCSDVCKIKFWNAFKKTMKGTEEVHQDTQKWVDSDLNEIPKEKEPPKETVVTVTLTPPMPTRNEGEDAFEFAARKNEWKRLYGK